MNNRKNLTWIFSKNCEFYQTLSVKDLRLFLFLLINSKNNSSLMLFAPCPTVFLEYTLAINLKFWLTLFME